MENPKNENSGIECFKRFCNNPRNGDLEIFQGSHKFLTLVLAQKISSPFAKKSILIGIFNEFIEEPVKNYVFNRISRKLLLELAIRILQEFIERGAERASSLKLVVAKATDGENTILIAPSNPDGEPAKEPYSAPEVLDTTFRLSDKSGLSPDVSFSIGKKRPPAFQRPDKTGYFTPRKGARKSLSDTFKVLLYLPQIRALWSNMLTLLAFCPIQKAGKKSATTVPAQASVPADQSNSDEASANITSKLSYFYLSI